MKSLICSIAIIFCGLICKAQYPVQQNLGSATTLVKNPNYGGTQGGLIPYSFLDTTSANTALTYLKNYNGALIYTTSDSALYFRSTGRWTQILPSGGSTGQRAWLLTPTNVTGLSQPAKLGPSTAEDFNFVTNSLIRMIIPSNGIVRGNLAQYKTVVIDTIGKGLYYNDGGSSSGVTSVGLTVTTPASPAFSVSNSPITTSGNIALNVLGTSSQIILGNGALGSSLPSALTPTWQQTLTAGSNLNVDNSSDLGGNDFSLSNGGEIYFNSNTASGFGGVFIAPASVVITATGATGRLSDVNFKADTIVFKPGFGNLKFDTLRNETVINTLLGWTNTSDADRGKVGYITLGTGLSLSSGVLSAAASGLTVGTSPIASGTTTRILYDNAGVLGEYTITGSGTVVAMQTSPSFVTSVIGGASFDVFNTTSTTINAFGAATSMTIGGTPTSAITHNYSTNATATATTKTINFGTGGAAGSTTNINIGSSNGGTLTINEPTTVSNQVFYGNANSYNDQTGTTYTLVAGDNGKIVTVSNASAITVTVPASLPTGFNCTVVQKGAGQITFAASSTTLNNRQSFTKTAGQYAAVAVIMYASNTFILQGDMQ